MHYRKIGPQMDSYQASYEVSFESVATEGKVEGSFETPFMIQSHTESMRQIVGAL